MARGMVADAAAICGVGCVGYGLWLVSPSALFIVGGVVLVAGAFLWQSMRRGRKE